MTQETWNAVDDYLTAHFVPADPTMEHVLTVSQNAGLPPHNVSPTQGKLLMLLARMHGSRRILEIGTLGGYSTIWLARALPPDGHLTTLEIDATAAQVAQSNIDHAGLRDRTAIHVGAALESLRAMVDNDEPPFDLIFIDADKPNNPAYLDYALRLSRRGSVIIGDNVIRDGAVLDSDSDDPRVQGVRTFNEQLANEPRLSATAIQTVGSKGYDGFALAIVIAD